ncbi:ABC transporter permease [Aeromonas sanarellii]|uniref:ABC transporter permease n=1 Tax=Aeromonas sanarellii TaxID=633415 RepID=UPI003BA3BBD9
MQAKARLLVLLTYACLLGAPLAGGLLLLAREGIASANLGLLLAQPGLWRSAGLSLWVAGASTLGALAFTALLLALGSGRPWMRWLHRLLSPLLALPHVAFAIGFAFLLAPSGWLLRLFAPLLGVGDLPPDWQTLRDPWGLGLIVALILKETPFLLLMALAAQDPARVARQQWLGESLGFSGPQLWWRLLLPALWLALRLPLYAVAAYGLAVVDLALLLGPDAPPPLAVRLWLWYQDADLRWRGASSSGALLLLALNLLLLAALRLLEWGHVNLGKVRWLDGRRAVPSPWPERFTRAGVWALLAINLLVLASLLLWSLARRWSFPALWPSEWSDRHWLALLPTLGPLLWQSLWLALLCAALSLLLAVLCLEAQPGRGPRGASWSLWLVCLPLLLPQASLLFGLRLQIDDLGLSGIGPGWVLWSQLVFVFPYVYLCLHGPYRQFDDRLTRVALSLGAGPWRAWWRVKGPLLARPLLFAFGVGAAVSLAQYLPTLLFGAGRVVTITTEAVAIGSGLNRRLAGLYGLLQLLLPLFIYGLVLWLPRRINPALRP